MTACMHTRTNEHHSSRSVLWSPEHATSDQVSSRRALKRANASVCLRLGSPKDLGLLFIRPYETCYCCSCLELCRFCASRGRIAAMGDITFLMPCSPSATLLCFGLQTKDHPHPCWPSRPLGVGIECQQPGMVARWRRMGQPLESGKRCRERAWLPS
jgi:hypothetical protein